MIILAQVLTNLPPNVSQDIAKVLGDFGLHLTATDIGQALVAMFIIARILRKSVPNSWQNNIVGTALKHAALEVSPGSPNVVLPAGTTTTTNSGNGPK